MAQEESNNKVGHVPEFTPDSSTEVQESEEVAVKPEDENLPEEKETPEPTEEKPAEEQPAPSVDTTVPSQNVENSQDLGKAIQGLQEERVKLLKEISELKGQRREIKQDQLERVEQQIDELKDLHPDDIALIDRVLKAKGIVTKEEANQMFYKSVQDEELNAFLERYPEYKPENDPGDANWIALQRELGLYRTPSNPRGWREVLERAHRSIVKVPSAPKVLPAVEVKRRQIETASVGGGGKAPSAPSNIKSLSPEHRMMLKQGGFSDEEISAMEGRIK